ncbi:hypothetical protein DPMN_017489 [Dreissena polymorpha]|uniref:Uncharacterized protein n=1 Tax=Dreissena polymorpha TaxID=45954 RepID=A0A9D4S876_DREPO|nr:hypothetical protein DPMN_017489 [Dreissena polymorpha]
MTKLIMMMVMMMAVVVIMMIMMTIMAAMVVVMMRKRKQRKRMIKMIIMIMMMMMIKSKPYIRPFHGLPHVVRAGSLVALLLCLRSLGVETQVMRYNVTASHTTHNLPVLGTCTTGSGTLKQQQQEVEN